MVVFCTALCVKLLGFRLLISEQQDRSWQFVHEASVGVTRVSLPRLSWWDHLDLFMFTRMAAVQLIAIQRYSTYKNEMKWQWLYNHSALRPWIMRTTKPSWMIMVCNFKYRCYLIQPAHTRINLSNIGIRFIFHLMSKTLEGRTVTLHVDQLMIKAWCEEKHYLQNCRNFP